jgi:type III pantothenate kinase
MGKMKPRSRSTSARKKTAPERLLLTVDIGNTNIVLGIFAGERLIDHWRIATELKKTEDEYALTLQGLVALNEVRPADASGAIIASVVPHLCPVFQKSIRRVFGVEARILDHTTPIPVRNRYENPQEVGVDRLANAVGGKTLFGAPLIIVDFGTAITLDVVSPAGDYLGGVIMPGLEMSADALYKRTSRLPRILLERPAHVLGRTTIASMQSGLYFGLVSAIDGVIEKLWKELGFKSKVVATGGLAPAFAAESKLVTATDPFLTLHGLRLIWEYNQKRQK